MIIGGEELHNNHHTYPTSAKLSVKPYEFDIGWVYIRGLEMLGLAKVRKTPPKLQLGAVKPVADAQDARGGDRQPLRGDGQVRQASCAAPARAELARLKAAGRARHGAAGRSCGWPSAGCTATTTRSRTACKPQLAQARCAQHPVLDKLVAMREELRQLWTRTNVSAEQLVADLQAWCRKAEESGIAALQEFSLKLRAAHA